MVQLNNIPSTPEQTKLQNYQKIAGAARIDKYGDFALIDNLVKAYNGAYDHDDIFNLEVIMVQNMILLNKEIGYVESKVREIQNQVKN